MGSLNGMTEASSNITVHCTSKLNIHFGGEKWEDYLKSK